MKKRRTTIYDLGRVPVTERVNTTGYEDGRSLLKRLQAEEVEAAEAAKRAAYFATPVGKAEAEYSATLREYLPRLKKFWSQSIAELNEFEWNQMLVDPLGDYPIETDRKTDADRVVFDKFYNTLLGRSIRLSDDGWMRMFKFVACLARERNVKISEDTLFAVLQRMKWELSVFANGEVIGDILKPAPPVQPSHPQSEKSIEVINDLLESTSTESHVWKKVVAQGWSADFSKWFYAWIESLKKNFDYDFPVEKLGPKAASWLQKWNLSPFSYASWNRCRVSFVKSGDFPAHMLTDQERLSDLIESSPLHDYETRRSIARWGQELINAGTTPPPHK